MRKVIASLLFLTCMVFGGGIVTDFDVNTGKFVYKILPQCMPDSSDTIGPLSYKGFKGMTVSFAGGRVDGADTAIIDSGAGA